MALAVLAPVLNWVTTGDHLVKTLGEGYWPVAGIDLLLLAGAVVAVWRARKQYYAAKTWHGGQAPVLAGALAVDALPLRCRELFLMSRLAACRTWGAPTAPVG